MYLGQTWSIKAMQVTPRGPDKNHNPHQRGRAGGQGTPFCADKKTILKTLKSISISD